MFDLINDLIEKSLANWCTIQLLCNEHCDVWMVLVWRNCVHSPNFPAAKHSRYTVLHVADKMTQTEDPEKNDCYVLVIPQYEYTVS